MGKPSFFPSFASPPPRALSALSKMIRQTGSRINDFKTGACSCPQSHDFDHNFDDILKGQAPPPTPSDRPRNDREPNLRSPPAESLPSVIFTSDSSNLACSSSSRKSITIFTLALGFRLRMFGRITSGYVTAVCEAAGAGRSSQLHDPGHAMETGNMAKSLCKRDRACFLCRDQQDNDREFSPFNPHK
jgi:hypothetical protein